MNEFQTGSAGSGDQQAVLAARAEGRAQRRVVSEYLDLLEMNKPQRGRRKTPEAVQARIDAIGVEMQEAKPIERLQLIQERLDLEDEKDRLMSSQAGAQQLQQAEDAFVRVASTFSERKGYSYSAWRELGVSSDVLKKAGIARTRRSSSSG